jgi:prepilin signal peptidase PulO-like enzyme (type II secretory pathway)
MYGSVIHANAFNNILHEDSRYTDWSGWPFILITNLLLLAFIGFLIFFHYPKIINIVLVTLLTLPMLYLAVKFMEYGIYISVGATVLHLIVIEEMVEVIDPFYKRIANKFKLMFKR